MKYYVIDKNTGKFLFKGVGGYYLDHRNYGEISDTNPDNLLALIQEGLKVRLIGEGYNRDYVATLGVKPQFLIKPEHKLTAKLPFKGVRWLTTAELKDSL